MKRALLCLLCLCLSFALCACGSPDRYDLTESTFFYTMKVIQMNPSDYVGKTISFDCFTYLLTDVEGNEYLCGVRKCSSDIGCKCGRDTIIGFILDYDGKIPAPKNQSEDTPDKTWIHIEGTLPNADKEEFSIYAYNGDEIDYGTLEPVAFNHFTVTSLALIEDYSGLKYYVTN